MTSSRAPAIIYARVSSTKQVQQGDGLSSQITRCRLYAEQMGHEVVDMFTDDISGRFKKRPGVQALIAFLKKQKRPVFVIIDDISRLARSLDTHRALRDEIRDSGGLLVSPSVNFGETSDDQLIENLLASVAQHQQQKKSRANQASYDRTHDEWLLGVPGTSRVQIHPNERTRKTIAQGRTCSLDHSRNLRRLCGRSFRRDGRDYAVS